MWHVPIVTGATAGFTANAVATTVLLTSTASGGAVSWDFGDGNTSTQTNPTHTFAGAGLYNVCQYVAHPSCPDTMCQQINIGCAGPFVGWVATPNGLQVDFLDQTPGNPQSWLWDFGDGNTSGMQSPSHTYASAGTYQVCLTVTDSCGSDSTCGSTTVCAPPVAGYSFVQQNLNYQFTDASAGSSIATWSWDFGDGNNATVQNPMHTYAAAGSYNVCLTVTDACGQMDTTCQNITLVGIDLAETHALKLAPNPASGQVQLSLQRESSGPLTLRISDLKGRKVYEREFSGADREFAVGLDLNQLARGAYMLQLQAGEQVHNKILLME